MPKSEHFIKSYLVLILVFLCSTFSNAQEYNLQNFNVKEGLTHSQVSSIFQDSKGYIWLATYGGGISKYNGNSFKNYTTADGLSSNVLRSACEDNNGNIWLGSLGGGVSIIKNDTIISLDTLGSGMDSFIYTLLNDSANNTIWIGTGLGIHRYKDGKLVSFTKEHNLPKVPIMNIFKDSKNRMWFTLWNEGLYCFEKGQFTIFRTVDGLCHETAFVVKEDHNKNIWVASFGGLNKIFWDKNNKASIETFDKNPGQDSVFVSGLEIDQEGNIWIGYNNQGVLIYNPITESTKSITSNTGLTSDVAYFLFCDSENNTWISNWGTGVSLFSSDRFVSYNKFSGIEKEIIKSIFIDTTDFFALGSNLYKQSGKKWFSKYLEDELKGYILNTVYKDSKNRIWVATTNELLCFKNGHKTIYAAKDSASLNLQSIRTITEDSKGNIWVGSWSGGVSFFDGEKFKRVNYAPLKNSYVFNLSYINDVLWIGTASLIAYYEDSQWNYFKLDSIEDKSLVMSIAFAKNGDLWAAAFGQGLFHISNPLDSLNRKVIKFSTKNILQDDAITAVKFNKDKSYLWAASSKGLDRLDVNSYKKTGKFNIRHYSHLDGFVDTEVNTNAILSGENNDMWFGTKSGLIKYISSADKINTTEPRTYITNIRLFYETVDWKKLGFDIDNTAQLPINLKLDYSQNHISFDFVGINTSSPKKVRYKYYLEGAEETWSPVTSRTEVTYSSLNYGKYTFNLIARNNNGVWNTKPVSFSFTIKPPFYRTNIFYILVFTFMFLGFFGYTMLRTRKLRKDKHILENKVRLRTTEIEQQKEEILTQNEDLQQQNEEILTQRDAIQDQKEIIEEIHHEVSQSIDYATRLQQSILPEEKILEKYVDDHFVLFLPKDKVSGDFYWWTNIENHTVITAADCTGHGVPGAFMSMLGVSFLREIVMKEYITHTGVILRKLRKEIVKSLKQTGKSGTHKDGMDMALISINHENNLLQFSGANNPLYIVKNKKLKVESELESFIKEFETDEDSAIKLYEIKPDKMPIAIYEKMDKFQTHEIQLEKGDQLYMFSDGYPDQFGGAKGKKFKYKPFKKLLLENANKPMSEQLTTLETAFFKWKGHLEQIDDVVIVGIKI